MARRFVVFKVGYIILFPVFFLMLPRAGVDSALAKAAKLVFFSELLLLVGPTIAYAKMRRRYVRTLHDQGFTP
ncbi:hypothetical protein LMG919_16390 [Xanthomonas vesicatoria]|nr:hypothetical protein LMG919_16390 [Xanthomonas vesicatoria]